MSVSKCFDLFCLRLLRLLSLLLWFSVSCSSGLLGSLCPFGVSSFISVSLLLLLWLGLLVVGLCREVSSNPNPRPDRVNWPRGSLLGN